MSLSIYDYVDNDLVSVSLSKANIRKNDRISLIDSKNTVKHAEPVIQPKMARLKSNLRRTSIYPSCVDAKKTEKYQARYRVKTFKYSKNFKFLVTNRSKRKRINQHDENCEAKKRKSDGSGQESGGKPSQAEINDQKRQKDKTLNEKQLVIIDGNFDGGEAKTSVEYLFEYYVMFDDLP